MHALDQLIHAPRLHEIDAVEMEVPIARVWEEVRHGDLARTPLIRALFALRDVPNRLAGHAPASASIRIDELASTADRPGFQLLLESPLEEVAVGAIGKVWQPQISFAHVPDASAFAEFREPDFIKVAWALQMEALDERRTRLGIELRVDATDEHAWQAFKRYFMLIGPASRFVRRSALAGLAHELADRAPPRSVLPGDELLTDAVAEIDHAITIHAPPSAVWPWLVQMGCGRAGFYSIDVLDNAGVRSAREVHPEWQKLAVGDSIAITPDGKAHFEVLALRPEHTLVLGGLFDAETGAALKFDHSRPEHYWHVTWAFVLQLESPFRTRVCVRARAAFSGDGAWHAHWIRPVHDVMERAQLRHLRARVEGSLVRDDARDVLEGLGGAARIAAEMLAPSGRKRHVSWGISAEDAARSFPGDELLAEPIWGWTHAVSVKASADVVWPWLAQIGATRGGFYSYQWLENLAGCDVRNAEVVHPEWQMRLGDELYVHPDMPPLRIARMEPGRWFVAHAASERIPERHWVSVSWLFLVEPAGVGCCRVISRYRAAHSEDLGTRISFGPSLLRPIGFAMDRRMLEGIRERVERVTSDC
jgi:hypothetical protein